MKPFSCRRTHPESIAKERIRERSSPRESAVLDVLDASIAAQFGVAKPSLQRQVLTPGPQPLHHQREFFFEHQTNPLPQNQKVALTSLREPDSC
jgi:hypothetical protein